MFTEEPTMTTHKPATPPLAGYLLPPVPYGATRFEVQRDANSETRNPAYRVATFDTLAAAQEYVHAANAYPRLVGALREAQRVLRANRLHDAADHIPYLLRELGEDA